MKKFTSITWLTTLFIFLFTYSAVIQADAQKVDLSQLKQLKYRHIGPLGNRLTCVAGVAQDPLTYYVGAASGGIWKTADGGVNWKAVIDDKPVHSIGAIEVSASDPQVVWAGTGESSIRSNVSVGDGVWKSTDGGTTWNNMGLENTFRVSRLLIHPTNPDVVFVGSLGHAYAPQKDRGVFRTTDGGKTWAKVLYVNDSTGVSDMVMDPNNPRIIFAGMWQLDIKTWGRQSGGKGSGIFVTRDGGDTWKRLSGNGLPKLSVGKISLTIPKADSKKIYALIETSDGVPMNGKEGESGELWRSDDGGEKWARVSQDLSLGGRGAYYTRCKVTPDDADEIYFMASAYSSSLDGGKTTKIAASQPNWDHHEMWIDPTNGNRQAVAGDGGVSISQNRGKSWYRIQLPVAQLYHVTVDNQVPYYVYANRQDGPSAKGPSRFYTEDFLNSGIPRGEWHDVGGGESGFATPDPTDPNIVWSSASGSGAGGGIVVKYNEKVRQFRQVEVWPEATFGSPAKDVKYRFQWTFPLVISSHDHNTVYVTSQHVHKTTNGGQSWQLASPDLTTNDKSKQNISGGLTPDNIGVEYACVIYALDESPIQKNLLWAGTNDGLVQVTQDGGTNWENVTKNIKGLPPLGTVRNIEASKWKAGKAYITVDFHQVGNFEPWVFKTEDFGKTWVKITDGIPKSNLSYACNIREDPTRQGLLYLGTENALYVSFNDGLNWQSLMTNLPASPMYWIAIQENFNDLVVGTYGRGIWVLDDITPLQQMTTEISSSAAHLFAPRQAYRFHPVTGPFAMFDDQSDGDNPPLGAPITYWLSADAKDSLLITVKDANNSVVRKLHHLGKAGLNRVWWDLREDPSTAIVMRNKPLFAEWITLNDKRTMNAPTSPKGIAPLVLPGSYTVVLKVGEKEYSQPLKVLKDPNSEGTEADIVAQKNLLNEVKKDMSSAAEIINQLEWIRRQAEDLKSIAEDQKNTDVTKAIETFEQQATELENTLIQLKITPQGQGGIRWPAQVVEKLQYLGGAAEVADFAPANQHKEVHQVLQQRLQDSKSKFNQLIEKELPAFQEVLRKNNFNGSILIKTTKVVN
jgi:photosystem II stability/assembly factor-like uncharacterized protein